MEERQNSYWYADEEGNMVIEREKGYLLIT
jgi:hypothetical protein